jgi:diacylglycerol kinase family enzyme
LAALAVLRRYPLVSVQIQADAHSLHRKTPFVFIGNNRYEMNLLAMGARQRLDGGNLSVYSTSRMGRFGLLLLMLRGLVGRLDQGRDFDDIVTHCVRVETRKHVLRVACDGEVREMMPPLIYRILPAALKVLAP